MKLQVSFQCHFQTYTQYTCEIDELEDNDVFNNKLTGNDGIHIIRIAFCWGSLSALLYFWIISKEQILLQKCSNIWFVHVNSDSVIGLVN